MTMQLRNFSQAFLEIADQHPNRVFAETPDGPLTFAMLSAQADAMAAMLAAEGLRPGAHVMVMMANSPVSLALVQGILRAGFIWVPTNPALVSEGLAHAIRLVEADAIFCDADILPVIEACGARPALGAFVLDSIPDAVQSPVQRAIPTPDDLAALMFTSGTTGPSKAVMVTHKMLELAGHAVIHCTDLAPGDRFYMWEPFYHIGGAQLLILPFLAEVTLVLRPRFSASRFWQEVSECGATHIHHLGGIVQILLKQPPGPFDRNHRVRIAWGGGCAPDVWREFENRFGLELRECYGMTEASSITTCNRERVVGAVGRPLPWFDVQLKDEAGRVLGAEDGRGEIVVTSDVPGAIFTGYYRNPKATAEALRSDGFHTGDAGSWNAEGMLVFHGRLGDSVRSRGENVSAYEVESVANRHPDVDESAMIGVAAEIGEQDILLFVRPRAGAAPDPAALWDWMAPKLAPYQRPRFIALIDEFPKTPSQRIQKHRLPKEPHNRWKAPALRKGGDA